MRVQDVMTRRVRTIDSRASVERARSLMTKGGVHHLPVRDSHRRIVGMISWNDLRAAPERGAVEDFMAHRLLIVRPDTSLGGAAALMRAHAIGALPVMDGVRLAGILTRSDLLDVVDHHADSLSGRG
jgi:CBS domain-containing protein